MRNWLVTATGLALVAGMAGCNKPAPPVSNPVTTAAMTPAPPTPPPAPPAPKVSTEATGGAEPRAKLEGLLVNAQDNVRMLKPNDWHQVDVKEGGPLLKLTRDKTIGGVRVTVSLSAVTDPNLPASATIESLKDGYLASLPTQLAKNGLRVDPAKNTTLAGRPALAIKSNFEEEGHKLRAKQVLTLAGGKIWVFQGVGAAEGFDEKVEPELNALAATVELP